jgi:hypothetical protein
LPSRKALKIDGAGVPSAAYAAPAGRRCRQETWFEAMLQIQLEVKNNTINFTFEMDIDNLR